MRKCRVKDIVDDPSNPYSMVSTRSCLFHQWIFVDELRSGISLTVAKAIVEDEYRGQIYVVKPEQIKFQND